MLGCAGAGLHGGGAQRCGAALGEDNTVHAGAIGHAQQRAQVLRIFHAVESQDETRCGGLTGSRREQIFERKKLLRVHQRDHALMRGGPGGNSKLLARLLENTDAGLAALGHQPLEARIVPLAGHEHVVKAPLSGFQSLLHRMQAVENFHEIQCTARAWILDSTSRRSIRGECGRERPHHSRSGDRRYTNCVALPLAKRPSKSWLNSTAPRGLEST